MFPRINYHVKDTDQDAYELMFPRISVQLSS